MQMQRAKIGLWHQLAPRTVQSLLNPHHQRFCTRARCRKASKILSQKQWLAKPENRKLWGGPGEVERVRAWRKAHPYYWKRTCRSTGAGNAAYLTIDFDDLEEFNGANGLITSDANVDAILRRQNVSGETVTAGSLIGGW